MDRCAHGRRFYAFNSFFWKKLTEQSGLDGGPHFDAAFARVAKWTKVGIPILFIIHLIWQQNPQVYEKGFQPVVYVFILAKVGRRRSPGPARRLERAPACALCDAFRMSRASTAYYEKGAAGRLPVYSAATRIRFSPMLFYHQARMSMPW